MKNFKFLAVFALAVSVVSQGAFAKTDVSLAVLDVEKVMNGTTLAKKGQTDLKSKSEEAQKRINKMEDAFMQRVEDHRSKRGVLSEEKYAEMEAELRRQRREDMNEVQAINEKLGREYKRLQKRITDEIDVVVTELSKERGYGAVIAKSYLIYAANAVDISADVLDRVNERLAKIESSEGL